MKIYNHDAKIKLENGKLSGEYRSITNEEIQKGKEEIRKDIETMYGKAYSKKNELSASVHVEIVGDIEVVDDLSKVKSYGPKPDDLIILVTNPDDYRREEDRRGAVGLTLGPNIMLMDAGELLKDMTDHTYTHEFTHQRYGNTFGGDDRDHATGGVMRNPATSPNLTNLWNLGNTINLEYKDDPT